MTMEAFDCILRHITLPIGKLLEDGRTYRLSLSEGDIEIQDEEAWKMLGYFDKLLVLSDGEGHVVGGVLFYGRFDLQVLMLDEYKGCGYMSAIHGNGILRAELDPEQEVSICMDGIASVDDFNMKVHLLSLIGLKAKNEDFLREQILPFYENGFIHVIHLPFSESKAGRTGV